MTADEMIDGYVAEVVLLLPQRQRADVARELRDLIGEEVAGAAGTRSGRAEAVTAVLAGFGRPAEVAARYRAPIVVIDPSDSRRLLTLAGGGAVLIVAGAVLGELIDHPPAQRDLAAAVDRAAPLIFGWLGLLVAWFAVAAWWRRRHPAPVWKPRPLPSDRISRAARTAALAFFVAGTLALVFPAATLRLVTGGRAAQAAYDAFTFDDDFLAVRGPIVLGLLILSLLLQAAVIWQGRLLPWNHRVDPVLSLLLCAVLTWVVAGPVYVSGPTDRTAKEIVALLILVSLAGVAFDLRRHRVRQAVLSR
ncbi:hypothetical protein Aph02nite_84600 [Actinoplanes philippinensis]|uniref:Uncharacterized protein n=1 Tax=Actinoplanes philippinensis TaxID=35752 RepID=A0A1I2EPP7_9ACTN|nr:hypothetical protein [Actinoplanes philippinensis]GIE82510.1 hypothetical protein Aph02nite_84600 [Actinoplanes philippinensis]SFE94805.1 hypothetical protein SAMN05421541_104634 [Actinoplanes philippinensis]